jgi:hypothetical protein
MLFKKKPTTVEAWQWSGDHAEAGLICEWIAKANGEQYAYLHPHEELIVLGDNYESVKPGQWIIRDQFNDFWPLQDDVFRTVYETSF